MKLRMLPPSRSEAEVDRPPIALSVVFLVRQEPAPLDQLYREYVLPLAEAGGPVECIFAMEPWLRERAAVLEGVARPDVPIHVLVTEYSRGETWLVRMAAPHCRGPRLLILEASRRLAPSALPRLVAALDEADLAVARRLPRTDSRVNRIQSALFHRLVSKATGTAFHDLASGARAVRRELLDALPIYGDLYPFLPVLAAREGYTVREVDAPQHASEEGTRLFGPSIYLRRALDVFGLYFMVRFTEKPLRFFGLVGTVVAAAGSVLLGIVFVQRLAGQGIADRPVLLLGMLLLVLGLQSIALGLVGELIVHVHAGRRARYRLARPPAIPEAKPGGRDQA